MIKTVFKELMIILLLCVVILLILSILLYDYNPINKVVPNKIAYSAPENIRNELEESIENTISIENRVYTIDGSDLNIYKKNNSYNPSKQNPFASTPSEDTNVSGGKSNVNTQTQGQTQTQTPTTNEEQTPNGQNSNVPTNQNTGTKLK